ncbi:hypothetical protein B0T21DRAFT_349516 [Apiosordaria backusii]|uniref:Uncharacterized protein n=1 Tax=Apiosordaria backusii TaxID=314023 RepID=A0AA40BE15_9PEZI|nr:hypothetical protein B0T21DRAFT_349516 [Apiosordaria backusii]
MNTLTKDPPHLHQDHIILDVMLPRPAAEGQLPIPWSPPRWANLLTGGVTNLAPGCHVRGWVNMVRLGKAQQRHFKARARLLGVGRRSQAEDSVGTASARVVSLGQPRGELLARQNWTGSNSRPARLSLRCDGDLGEPCPWQGRCVASRGNHHHLVPHRAGVLVLGHDWISQGLLAALATELVCLGDVPTPPPLPYPSDCVKQLYISYRPPPIESESTSMSSSVGSGRSAEVARPTTSSATATTCHRHRSHHHRPHRRRPARTQCGGGDSARRGPPAVAPHQSFRPQGLRAASQRPGQPLWRPRAGQPTHRCWCHGTPPRPVSSRPNASDRSTDEMGSNDLAKSLRGCQEELLERRPDDTGEASRRMGAREILMAVRGKKKRRSLLVRKLAEKREQWPWSRRETKWNQRRSSSLGAQPSLRLVYKSADPIDQIIGSFTIFRSSERINTKADGPDELFHTLEVEDIGLRRNPAAVAGHKLEGLTRHFQQNFIADNSVSSETILDPCSSPTSSAINAVNQTAVSQADSQELTYGEPTEGEEKLSCEWSLLRHKLHVPTLRMLGSDRLHPSFNKWYRVALCPLVADIQLLVTTLGYCSPFAGQYAGTQRQPARLVQSSSAPALSFIVSPPQPSTATSGMPPGVVNDSFFTPVLPTSVGVTSPQMPRKGWAYGPSPDDASDTPSGSS